jgi:ADP-ribose pyrophosphatase YjhB (NUDIX family)
MSSKKVKNSDKKVVKDASESESETESEAEKISKKPKKTSSKKSSKKLSSKKSSSERKTIYLNDDVTRPVTAAGAIFYKQIGKDMMLLLIENRAKYEDIGGKIDPDDEDIYEAAAREIEEETNGQIKSDDVIERLKTASYIYVPKSKYVIYIIEANADEKKLKKDDFGDREEHDGFERTIGWIARKEIAKPTIVKFKLNWRMISKSLFDKLAEIEGQFKFKKSLFKKKAKTKTSDLDSDSD